MTTIPARPCFTPGPWEWTDAYTLRPTDPQPSSQHVHTILDVGHIGWPFVGAGIDAARAEADANQALMAAAPDLYDAAEAAARVLAKQRWIKGSTDPEAIALFKLIAALEKAGTPIPALNPAHP